MQVKRKKPSPIILRANRFLYFRELSKEEQTATQKRRIGPKMKQVIMQRINRVPKNYDQAASTSEGITSLSFVRKAIKDNQIIREVRRQSLTNPIVEARVSSLMFLQKTNTPQARRAIRKAVFDTDRAVREVALKLVVEKEGYGRIVREIKRVFPLNAPQIERAFFELEEGNVKDTYTQSSHKKNQEEVTHTTLHRGLKTHFTKPNAEMMSLQYNGKRRVTPFMGKYIKGELYINGDSRIVPQELRGAVMEHEFGELWGHELGHVFELLWLKKNKKVKLFWDYYKDKPFDFVREQQLQQIIKKYPKLFSGMEKIIK
jgi:hypothetical protein